jgi:uncharacterized membrane protein
VKKKPAKTKPVKDRQPAGPEAQLAREQPRRPPQRHRRIRVAGPPPKGLWGFIYQFQRYLIGGMLVWVPLLITIWVTWLAVAKIGGVVESSVRFALGWLNRVGTRVPGLGFLTVIEYRPGVGIMLTVAIFLATGLVARYLVARKVINLGERIVDRLPLVNKIYRAVQQIRDVFVGRGGEVFHEVVLVQHPYPGVYAVGFVTSEEPGIVQETLDRVLTPVFVPTTPNPTSGFILFYPSEDVVPLNISIEEGMKLIISAGAYDPGSRTDPIQKILGGEEGA